MVARQRWCGMEGRLFVERAIRFVRRAIVGGMALGLWGCGTSDVPQERLGSIHEAVSGSNTETWTTAATPWGGVGFVTVSFNDCPLLCEDGRPPAPRSGCQNAT